MWSKIFMYKGGIDDKPCMSWTRRRLWEHREIVYDLYRCHDMYLLEFLWY